MSTTPWATLAAAITRLGDRIDGLPTVREASVASLSPLSIRFDTDTEDTLVQGSLSSGLAVGLRVMTIKLRHYVWVIGVKGGSVRYAEYSFPVKSLANGAVTTLDQPSRITGTSVGPLFAEPVAGGLRFEPGIYQINGIINYGGVASSTRVFVQAVFNPNPYGVGERFITGRDEDTFGGMFIRHITATANVLFQAYQLSGESKNATLILKITKIN